MDTIKAPEEKKLGHIKNRLICNCCGQYAPGRQWWNRDTGYGLCASCGDWQLSRGDSIEDIERSCGKRGIHWDIKK